MLKILVIFLIFIVGYVTISKCMSERSGFSIGSSPKFKRGFGRSIGTGIVQYSRSLQNKLNQIVQNSRIKLKSLI